MAHAAKLRGLKALNLRRSNVSLAIVKEYKRNRESQYIIKYVAIDDNLKTRLKTIITNKINASRSVEEYTFDCPEPEADQVRAIDYEETDFYRILEQLNNTNPEEDVIEDVDDLVNAKAYLIIIHNRTGIQVAGFKTIPENWKMRKSKGLIPLLFKENRFEDLEEENVFSISNTVDTLYYDEMLFILSKKGFEHGLNFREGMIAKAQEMYQEVQQLNIFVNMNILINTVGNNQRYLRKVATIRNLGHYNNPQFLQRFQHLNNLRNWNVQFQNGQIVLTQETLDAILSILQNKRLRSEFTEQDFDVESAKGIDP